MSTYQVINREGEVLNSIEASEKFMEKHYPPMPVIADNNEGPDEFWPQYRIVERPPAPTPTITVSMRQARKALVLSGITLESVYQAIEAIPDVQQRQLAVIDWDFADTVSSNSDLVIALAPALGINDIEALFKFAETLE